MKIKFFFLIAALLTIGMIQAENVMCLVSVTADGSSVAYELATVQKITFAQVGSEASMVIHKKNGSSTDGYKKISFALSEPSAVKNIEQDGSMYIFPNPVINTISVAGINPNSMVTVYDLNGKALLTSHAVNNRLDINVSNLSAGTYMLQVNKSVLKFIKQ